MIACTLRLSARDAAGHDSGRIHAARLDSAGRPVALCGQSFGTNGTADHGTMGPTCHRCRKEITR